MEPRFKLTMSIPPWSWSSQAHGSAVGATRGPGSTRTRGQMTHAAPRHLDHRLHVDLEGWRAPPTALSRSKKALTREAHVRCDSLISTTTPLRHLSLHGDRRKDARHRHEARLEVGDDQLSI